MLRFKFFVLTSALPSTSSLTISRWPGQIACINGVETLRFCCMRWNKCVNVTVYAMEQMRKCYEFLLKFHSVVCSVKETSCNRKCRITWQKWHTWFGSSPRSNIFATTHPKFFLQACIYTHIRVWLERQHGEAEASDSFEWIYADRYSLDHS